MTILSFYELKDKPLEELLYIQQSLNLEVPTRISKQEVIIKILKAHAKNGGTISGSGILDIVQDSYGFLRCLESNHSGIEDIYVSQAMIKKMNLRTGDFISGLIRTPKENEKYFALKSIETINNETLDQVKTKILFDNLTPEYACSRLIMEKGNGSIEDITARMIDLAAPFGKGQRGMIVAPPKTGKTMILQNIASSISHNYPECHLIILLIGERPEEVTEMRRISSGQVIASTFDEPCSRHIQLAELVIERAKRLVEQKQDVVILLDSLTRLARAYNTVAPMSGRVLSGGIEAQALQKPKRFFGAARNTSEGGSLTIIATALVETGSKMDEVIFEEFKGTGNMELYLQRKLAEKNVFPAINFTRSGTRRDDLLISKEELQKIWLIRRILGEMEEVQAIELLIDRLRTTTTNEKLFSIMHKM